MKIEFVNHASYLLNGSLKILCDPWLQGSAFNNGWTHLIESKHRASDFEDIDYIWISHEHPDHFHPKFFLNINEEKRKKITILFQFTRDKRVINFCKKLGFLTQELPLGKHVNLSKDVTVLCDRVGITIDSFLYIEIDGLKVLNLNDCILNDIKKNQRIMKNIKRVDILFTQFSYANWFINRQERIAASKNKIRAIETQLSVYKPKYFIPFASFIYFSHEENFFLNDEINNPQLIYDYFKDYKNLTTLIMRPGDIWKYGENFKSKPAIDDYLNALKKIKPSIQSNNVSEEILIKNSKSYIINNPLKFWMKLFLYLSNKSVTKLFISDINKSYNFSYENGLMPTLMEENEYDYKMSSDSLYFIFNNSFGAGTLAVNGRFESKIKSTRELSLRFFNGVLDGPSISFFVLIFRILRKYFKH
jgi:UDP-MurNAc hydroxylase